MKADADCTASRRIVVALRQREEVASTRVACVTQLEMISGSRGAARQPTDSGTATLNKETNRTETIRKSNRFSEHSRILVLCLACNDWLGQPCINLLPSTAFNQVNLTFHSVSRLVMHRLYRRRAACPLVGRRASTPPAFHPYPSIRARWMAIPITASSTIHRYLTTTSAASSPSSSPSPHSSQPFSTTPFLLVGLAVVAGTAALYATQPATASSQHKDRVGKEAVVQKVERVDSVVQSAASAQHTDNINAALPPLPLATSQSPPPAAETDDSSAHALQPAIDTAEASHVMASEITRESVTNSEFNTATAPTTTTETAPHLSPATPITHNHSPPEPATSSSRPLSAAEAAYLARYYSAPVDEHPSVRNLRILTANRIDEVIATSPPFLLYLFDPTCSACALYTPIVHALAYALDNTDDTDKDDDEEEAQAEGKAAERPSDGVRVYVMNDATDYQPGFFAPHEENVLPILKFFPQSHSSITHPPFQYTGSPHLSSILRFLHQQTGGAFNLERALLRARTRLPVLRGELAERGAKRLEESEDWALYLHSPCGERIQEYSMAELMSKYVEGVDGEESERSGAEEKYDKFVQCMEEREEDTMDYFETMAMIANETVQQLREKREKKRRQRESEGSSNDQARDGDNTAS